MGFSQSIPIEPTIRAIYSEASITSGNDCEMKSQGPAEINGNAGPPSSPVRQLEEYKRSQ